MHVSIAAAEFSEWPKLLHLVQEAFAYMDTRIDPPSSLKRMGIDEFKAKAAGEV